jgi:hypothetical protein
MAALRLSCFSGSTADHRTGGGTHARAFPQRGETGKWEFRDIEANRGQRRSVESAKRSAGSIEANAQRPGCHRVWFMQQPKEKMLAAEEPVAS